MLGNKRENKGVRARRGEGGDVWEQEGEQGGEGKERRGEGCLGTRGRTRG